MIENAEMTRQVRFTGYRLMDRSRYARASRSIGEKQLSGPILTIGPCSFAARLRFPAMRYRK
jgi:hypothetical protein